MSTSCNFIIQIYFKSCKALYFNVGYVTTSMMFIVPDKDGVQDLYVCFFFSDICLYPRAFEIFTVKMVEHCCTLKKYLYIHVERNMKETPV